MKLNQVRLKTGLHFVQPYLINASINLKNTMLLLPDKN